MNTEQNKLKSTGDIMAVVGVFSILGGLGFWAYQIYIWLRTGEWVAYSLLWPLSFIENLQSWVYYPYEWVGIHKILDGMPFSLSVIILGVGLMFGGVFFAEGK